MSFLEFVGATVIAFLIAIFIFLIFVFLGWIIEMIPILEKLRKGQKKRRTNEF